MAGCFGEVFLISSQCLFLVILSCEQTRCEAQWAALQSPESDVPAKQAAEALSIRGPRTCCCLAARAGSLSLLMVFRLVFGRFQDRPLVFDSFRFVFRWFLMVFVVSPSFVDGFRWVFGWFQGRFPWFSMVFFRFSNGFRLFPSGTRVLAETADRPT